MPLAFIPPRQLWHFSQPLCTLVETVQTAPTTNLAAPGGFSFPVGSIIAPHPDCTSLRYSHMLLRYFTAFFLVGTLATQAAAAVRIVASSGQAAPNTTGKFLHLYHSGD